MAIKVYATIHEYPPGYSGYIGELRVTDTDEQWDKSSTCRSTNKETVITAIQKSLSEILSNRDLL